MKKSLREWAADLFLVGMGILVFVLVAELLWATLTSERKADAVTIAGFQVGKKQKWIMGIF